MSSVTTDASSSSTGRTTRRELGDPVEPRDLGRATRGEPVGSADLTTISPTSEPDRRAGRWSSRRRRRCRCVSDRYGRVRKKSYDIAAITAARAPAPRPPTAAAITTTTTIANAEVRVVESRSRSSYQRGRDHDRTDPPDDVAGDRPDRGSLRGRCHAVIKATMLWLPQVHRSASRIACLRFDRDRPGARWARGRRRRGVLASRLRRSRRRTGRPCGVTIDDSARVRPRATTWLPSRTRSQATFEEAASCDPLLVGVPNLLTPLGCEPWQDGQLNLAEIKRCVAGTACR